MILNPLWIPGLVGPWLESFSTPRIVILDPLLLSSSAVLLGAETQADISSKTSPSVISSLAPEILNLCLFPAENVEVSREPVAVGKGELGIQALLALAWPGFGSVGLQGWFL